jgi:hypothetical protein
MPVIRTKPTTPPPADIDLDQTATTDEASQPSLYERLGGLRGIGAGGIRGLAGLLGLEGGWPGAAIGGVGEAAAELVGGEPLSLSRIGTEAGISAVPMAKIFKAGRPVYSAVRGGLMGAGSEAVRELAKGQEIDPSEITTRGLTAGAFGGLLGLIPGKAAPRFTTKEEYEKFKEAAAKAPKPTTYEVETTTIPGGRVLTGGKLTTKRGAPVLTGAKVGVGDQPRPIVSPGKRIEVEPQPYESATPPTEARVPYGGMPTPMTARRERLAAKDIAAEAKAAREAAKRAEEASKTARIEQMIEKGKLVPGKPAIRESVAARLPGGDRLSATTRYTAPKAIEGSNRSLGEKLADTPAEASRVQQETLRPPSAIETISEPQAPKAHIEAQVPAEADVTPDTTAYSWASDPVRAARAEAMKVQRTRKATLPAQGLATAPAAVGAETAAPTATYAGEWGLGGGSIYNIEGGPLHGSTVGAEDLQRMGIAVPEQPTQAPSALAQFFKTRTGATGKAYRLAQEAEKAGTGSPIATQLGRESAREIHLREIAAKKGAQTVTAAEPAIETGAKETPDWVKEQLSIVDRLSKLAKEESGGMDPRLAMRLGLGAAGAAAGAAFDPFDDPIASAIAGGALGAISPDIINKLGSMRSPDAIQQVQETTGENTKSMARKIFEFLPQLQRFNYLASWTGLPANALAGPYGSALFASLESSLAGDPRGTAALKHLANPINFIKELKGAWPEATELIGRAEGRPLVGPGEHPITAITNHPEKITEVPGAMMTTGDVAARRILERFGFSPEEARVITLTSEPELMPSVARLGKGAGALEPLVQLMFPFKRTPVNILEQGIKRLPGIGGLVPQNKIVADSMRLRLTQQGLGAAVGAGGYAVGSSVDPETAKWLRRYVSNFGGQYSLPASLGFSAGQAVRAGKPAITGAIKEIPRSFPLPTTEPITEWAKFITDPSVKTIPRGAYPVAVKEEPNILKMLGIGQQAEEDLFAPAELDNLFGPPRR